MTHTHPAYNVGRKVRDEMEYNRIFVALSADAAGYEFKGRKPAGRCLLETQNDTYKVLVNAQDLKPMVRYGVYLIFSEPSRYVGVQVGTLTVDDRGKGELRREVTKTQLHGFTPKDVVTVAVITTKGNHLESPLCGYPGQTVAWRKTFFDITSKPRPTPTEAESKKNHAPPADEPPPPIEPTPLSIIPPVIETQPATPQENEPQLTPSPITDTPPVMEAPPPSPPEPTIPPIDAPEPDDEIIEPPTIEPLPEPTPEPCPEPLPEPTPEPCPEPITDPPTEPAPVPDFPTPDMIAEPADIEFIPEPPPLPRKTTPYITTDTFAALRPMTPFALGDDDGVLWARFTADDCLPAPHGNVGFFDAPFVVESYECYTHFILGAVTDREITGYVLGVPGVYDGETALRAKELGLTEFRCYDPIPPTPGEFGYWLMGIV